MGKGQDFSRYQEGIVRRYYQNLDTLTLQKLGEIVSDLYLCTDPKKAERLWASARAALARTGAHEGYVAKVFAERSVEGLARLVTELTNTGKVVAPRSPAPPPSAPSAPPPFAQPSAAVRPGDSPMSQVPGSTPPSPAAPASAPVPAPPAATAAPPGGAAPAPPAAPSPDALKSALKAFRKRLKLTRLDAESSLGVGPMTKGQQSGIVAIQPPSQFPREVWEELARQGKLKPAGRGFYELVE